MKKLAVIITHPIQYYAPLFKLINERGAIDLKVFYTWEKEAAKHDKGFGKEVEWDIPLLEGYQYTFVSNNGNKKRSFWALKNPSLISEIESWGADSVLVFGWNYYSHLKALIYFKTKIPVYFRGDSHLLNENFGLKTIVRRLFLKWVYSHIDFALYVGKNNKDYYLAHGLKENQLIYAPHAIDNDRFYDNKEKHYQIDADIWKTKIGIQKENLVFGYFGKFEEVKNLFILIEAFSKLSSENIRLVLIGNGILETILKVKANTDKRIIFLGFQNQSLMPLAYRLLDVFILPSKSETWGLSVNEAMACSKAIIVSDRCGCFPELIDNNGFIFNSDDNEGLYKCLIKYIENSEMAIIHGIRSKEIIKNFDYLKAIEPLEKLINNGKIGA